MIPRGVALALASFVAVLASERLVELVLSARHTRTLRARGAVESGRGHFPLLVALHALLFPALVAEVLWLGARPGPAWPLWLVLFGGAQALRFSSQRALGERWTVRILAIPGEPLVRHGVYRLLRHPNYIAVALELLAGPLLFGAWRTALLATLWNAVAMAIRIPAEQRALARAIHDPRRGEAN
jgi:methyltransferase